MTASSGTFDVRPRQFARAIQAVAWGAAVTAVIVTTFRPAAIGVAAWQGGKAEPIRIRFQRGRDTATVTGMLRGDVQAEYVASARKNQRLTMTVSATPSGSIRVRARAAGVDLPLQVDARRRSSAVLPEDGDYAIWVQRVTASRGVSRYRLTVTIQ